jgi:hypothetical protein
VSALRHWDSWVSISSGNKEATFAQIVVPDHKELDRGTLRAIIRQADVSVDEFLSAL